MFIIEGGGRQIQNYDSAQILDPSCVVIPFTFRAWVEIAGQSSAIVKCQVTGKDCANH